MNSPCRIFIQVVAHCLIITGMTGCASGEHKPSKAQTQFAAGQEEAFALLQRSGIYVVRMVGPFQRPVVLWREEMTLAQAILDAGFLGQDAPTQILIQHGLIMERIAPARLLQGEDVPIQPGDVIHILP